MTRKAKKNGRNGHGALHLYRSYMFKDKDPVIDRLRTLVSDSGLSYGEVGVISNVSSTTLNSWFHGETKKPQYATVAAVSGSLGFRTEFVKDHDVNFQREIQRAKKEIETASKR